MVLSRQRAFIIIVLGLLFSQIIVLRYNLWDGFEFHKIKTGFGSIFGMQLQRSQNKELSSAFIGYILFAVFLFDNLRNKNARASKLYEVTLIVCVMAILFELRSIVLEIMNEYSGQHLEIGIILFALCISIYRSAYD